MNRRVSLRKPERLFMSLMIIVFILIVGLFCFQSTASGESVSEYVTIKVSKGDTLWTIAKDYVKDGEDIRDVISEIKYINNLKDSNIKVGQELIIEV